MARPRSSVPAWSAPPEADVTRRFRAAWAEAGDALLALVRADGAVDPDRPLLVGVTEAARQLGIKRSMAYRLLAEGRLPGYRIGRRRLVSTAALRDLVDGLPKGKVQADATGSLSPMAPEEVSRRGRRTSRRPSG